MAKAKDLRDKSLEELQAECNDLRKKLFDLVNARRMERRQFEKPHRIREAKKDIARLLTVITQKQSANRTV